MVDKPTDEKDDSPQVDAGWDDWEEPDAKSGDSDRPTVAPPFDLATYAKEKAAGDGTRPVNATDTAITLPPPASAAGSAAGPVGPASEPFSRRQTPRAVAPAAPTRRAPRPTPQPSSQNILALVNRNAPSVPPAAPGLEEGTALELVAKQADPGTSSMDPVGEMCERFALGDYSGALVIAEAILEDDPGHTEANEYAESCRGVLMQMYTARIGPLHRVPYVEVQRDQLRWLSIDHRAGFVLSLVDGVSSLEMILDVSGMPSLDALRILYELVEQRIISLR